MNSRPTWWENETAGLHAEWVMRSIAIVRVFAQPLGPRDPETGQPWKPWDWSCLAIRQRGERILICGAPIAPKLHVVALCKQAARDLGAKTLVWERWSCGRKRIVEVAL